MSPPPIIRVVRNEMLKSKAVLVDAVPMLSEARLKEDDRLKAVGEKEGAQLGPEWATVGLTVGRIEGIIVGTVVLGEGVGLVEGFAVGLAVGGKDRDGTAEGRRVLGLLEGLKVDGAPVVGYDVGMHVGAIEGAYDGNSVGAEVGECVDGKLVGVIVGAEEGACVLGAMVEGEIVEGLIVG